MSKCTRCGGETPTVAEIHYSVGYNDWRTAFLCPSCYAWHSEDELRKCRQREDLVCPHCNKKALMTKVQEMFQFDPNDHIAILYRCSACKETHWLH